MGKGNSNPLDFYEDLGESTADAYNELTGRNDKKREAKAKKKANKYNRDTILGEMERELEIKKLEAERYAEEVLLQSAQAEGRIEQSYGSNVQNAYITQLNSENAFLKGKVENQKSIGDLKSQAGGSGVRNSGSIELLIATEQAANNTEEALARKTIDSGMSAMVSGSQVSRREGLDKVEQVRTKVAQTLSNFEEGSAYMDLYNYKRERVTGATELQNEYLDDVIDSTYDWSGYLGDAIKIGAYAGMGAMTGGGWGALFGGLSGVFA